MSAEDAIEKIIGQFGKYQTFILILVGFGRFTTEFQLANVVFLFPSVDYVCRDNDSYNLTNYCPCESPEYDEGGIVSSVTNEWNLICGRTALASLTQSMLQVGIIPGSLLFGHISDRYGRKLAVVLAQFSTALLVIISSVLPQLWMFIVCRFFIGISAGGTMLCGFIFLIELSGKSFRPYLVGIYELTFVICYFGLAVLAYFVREWRYLQLVTSVPWLLVIVCYWILPESPRWLITMGKNEEAVNILTKIAIKNNRPTENIESIVKELKKESQRKEDHPTASYFDLFRRPKIRMFTIVNALMWFCCAPVYFGVNMYIGRLEGSLYVNVMLSAVFLVPALALTVVATLFIKRRLSIITCFTITALSLLVLIFVPADKQLNFAIIGQNGAYAAFTLIYLYTSELFPTVIRNSAIGFASVFARIGSFIAPFVVNIGVEWISILIFCVLALFAGCLCFFLPETKGTVLLNTIEQTEQSNNKLKLST